MSCWAVASDNFPRARGERRHFNSQFILTAGDLKRVGAVHVRGSCVFFLVEELVAVTVAPGIGVLPDFTTPVMEKLGAAGASCASERPATSNRNAMHRTHAR